MIYLLTVPPQSLFNVPAQRNYCCRACGEHFMEAARMGWLELADWTSGSMPCELRYEDVCEDVPDRRTPGAPS